MEIKEFAKFGPPQAVPNEVHEEDLAVFTTLIPPFKYESVGIFFTAMYADSFQLTKKPHGCEKIHTREASFL